MDAREISLMGQKKYKELQTQELLAGKKPDVIDAPGVSKKGKSSKAAAYHESRGKGSGFMYEATGGRYPQ